MQHLTRSWQIVLTVICALNELPLQFHALHFMKSDDTRVLLRPDDGVSAYDM